LFDNGSIINFVIENSSYKSSHPFINRLFENKVIITKPELITFENCGFVNWKIALKKQNREILGGEGGLTGYTPSNLKVVINKLAKEYQELVEVEIPDYLPLLELQPKPFNSLLSEECYVYLMVDSSNNYHKIGISNKPFWREKTLQSEKPTIELLASKRYINRKIAASFEKALHDAYSHKRLRGEWFELELEEVEELKITLNS
jgi:hypothetical protein